MRDLEAAILVRASAVKLAILIGLASGVIFCDARACLAQSASELIAGIVARSEALVSGRLEFQFHFKNGREKAAEPAGPSKVSFTRDSWAERSPGSRLTRINHRG